LTVEKRLQKACKVISTVEGRIIDKTLRDAAAAAQLSQQSRVRKHSEEDEGGAKSKSRYREDSRSRRGN
jgi:hypothetical protein